MRKLNMIAASAALWILAGLATAPGQTITERRIEGVSIQAAPRQTNDAAAQTLSAQNNLGDEDDPIDERQREQEAQMEAERLQLRAEAQRINTIRRAVMAITQDENLAEVMAHSSLTQTEIEELLERYDWSANLEAEKMRARRMEESMRQAGSQDYWSGQGVSAHDFPLARVTQQDDTLTGYVENKSRQSHERFRIECRIRTVDGSEGAVESEYVSQFEVGERRLIRFKLPWSDKTVTNVVITGCRSFSRPAAQQ